MNVGGAMQRAQELSYRTRAKNLDTLSRETFDVLVIGGGITGAGVARDAALRGLSVALVERKDFAAGTSSRSSKLIHGGLRYLRQGDVKLVREAATERYILRKLAPHLARPQQMLVPVNGIGGYGKIKVALMAFDRLAGVPDHEQYRMLNKQETLDLEPTLREEAVYGAGLYFECLTDDARLVMHVIKSAVSLGAVVANYAETVGFELENGRVAAACVRDTLSGSEFLVRGRTVINCAGPWVDAVRLLCEQGEKPRLRLTKGIHVTLPRKQLNINRLVVMTARDRRNVFAIPHGEVTYLGTTDTFYEALEDYPDITLDDVDYLLDAAGRTFSGAVPTADDVLGAWAGLRPLLSEEGKDPSEISRKDEIMTSETGLLSIAGGKLTTFRRMAERIVDMAAAQLAAQGHALPSAVGLSSESQLVGGTTGEDTEVYSRRLQERYRAVPTDIVDRLVELYGSNAEEIVDAIRQDPTMGERSTPESALTLGEVDYTVRSEMAVTLEDVLERRTRQLLWDPGSGLGGIDRVAAWMTFLLAWPPGRAAQEVARYTELTRQLRTFSAEPVAQAAGA